MAAGAYLRAVGACLRAAGACLNAAGACLNAAGACLNAADACLRAAGVCLNAAGACRERSTIGPVAMESVLQHVPNDMIAFATELATGNGLTLNALLLGSLATLLHRHSHSSRFAIGQTYVGRRSDQFEAVGSFSTNVRRPLSTRAYISSAPYLYPH